MSEPNFILFPVIQENIAQASIVPNTTYNQYLAWLTKYVDSINASKLSQLAELCCKQGLYSLKKWQNEKDDKKALISAQTKVANHLYNSKPLRKYKKKKLKQQKTKRKQKNTTDSDNDDEPSINLDSEVDNDDIMHDTVVDDSNNNNNSPNNNNNNNSSNNININDLINNPTFINAIKSISNSNNGPIPQFNKRPRPLSMEDELSIEPEPKRIKFTNPYLPPNPFISNNNNDHL